MSNVPLQKEKKSGQYTTQLKKEGEHTKAEGIAITNLAA